MEIVLLAGAVLILTVFALTWLGSAAWVYRDARRRNLESATRWGIGTVFTGYLGLVLYILAQGSSRSAALSGSAD